MARLEFDAAAVLGARPAQAQAKPLEVNVDAIPAALVEVEQWLLWKLEQVGGKWKKIPYHRGGYKVDGTKPDAWVDFDTAVDAYHRGGFDGIGFAFTDDDPFVFIDFDHIVDADGVVDPQAGRELGALRDYGAYVERSPSGQGAHAIVIGTIPEKGRKHGDREMYRAERYATFTGQPWFDTLGEPVDAQELIDVFFEQWFPPKEQTSTGNVEITLPTGAVDPIKVEWLKANCPSVAAILENRANYHSTSESDLGLAKDALRNGWDDQSTAELLAAWRLEYHPNTAKLARLDYFRRTLARAHADLAAEKANRPEIDVEALVESMSEKQDQDAEFDEHLLALPGLLGAIQETIYGRQLYPSRAAAAYAALATMTAAAQPRLTVNHYGGLGLNEQYVVIAATGFGKESLIGGVQQTLREAERVVIARGKLPVDPHIEHQLPASQQKLHEVLEHRGGNLMIFSDEFAEWLAATGTDSHRQGVIGYLMAAYTKAVRGHVVAPASRAGDYQPVEQPRISVFATTTGERLAEVLTRSQGEAGTYNRMVICPAERELPEKRYTGQDYRIPDEVAEGLAWILTLPPTALGVPPSAFNAWVEQDRERFEPLKRRDPVLAGRLGEQAMKLAGLVALARQRTVIAADDVALAAEIRLTLYHSGRGFIDREGGIGGNTPVANAVEQLTAAIRKHKRIPGSHLVNWSKQYARLDEPERDQVLRALKRNNEALLLTGKRGGVVLVAVSELAVEKA